MRSGTMDIPPGFTDGTVYVIGRERRGSAAACMSIKNPGATLLSLDAYSGKVKWRFPFVYQEINFEEIIIDNGVLFFPHGDTMFAIDAESGKERWRVNARRTIFSSCLCDETVLYCHIAQNPCPSTGKQALNNGNSRKSRVRRSFP